MSDLEALLAKSVAMHGHLCPGQVLGVRMAMRACRELGVRDPEREKKRLIVFVEIDRCATDAIAAVTGCRLGKRTLKYVDYGKEVRVQDRPGPTVSRVLCDRCGEGINDAHEVRLGGQVLCRACAKGTYYTSFEVGPGLDQWGSLDLVRTLGEAATPKNGHALPPELTTAAGLKAAG